MITITKIIISDKDKNGNPLINKFNKPYRKILLKCAEYGQSWVSGFINYPEDPRLKWEVGQKVDWEVITKEGGYINLVDYRPEPKIPQWALDMKDDIADLQERVIKLERRENKLEE